MHFTAGQAVWLQITALNHDGTPQGNPIVKERFVPLAPVAPETSHVTMFEFRLINADNPLSTASESIGLTVNK